MPRWESECPLLQIDTVRSLGPSELGVALDLSPNGLKIRLNNPDHLVSVSTVCELKILLGPTSLATVKAIPVWKKGSTVGFQVTEACSTWNAFFVQTAFLKAAV